MTHYPDELKASIIARMLQPQNASVFALAKETGIPKDTYGGVGGRRGDPASYPIL